MKRILACLLVMVLILSAFSACGSSSSTTETTSSEAESSSEVSESETESEEASEEPEAASDTEEAAEEETASEEAAEEEAAETEETEETEEAEADIYPLTDELVTLTFFTGFESEFRGVIESMDDFSSIAEAEEITNVHIDFVTTDGAAMVEKMNIMFNSGECTDFVSSATDFYPGGGIQAIEDGILIDLSELVESCMPNYKALLEENPDIKLEVTENDGSYSYIRKILEQNFVSIGMAVRQDWLDELNLSVPTTYDELTEVLEAFYTAYGCSDTIYLDKEGNFGYGFLAIGYGTPGYRVGDHIESQYYQVDGTVKSSLLEDGYRDYLKQVSEWYEAGYISSDFISADSKPGGDDQAAAINNNQTGVWKTSINVIGSMDSWLTNEDVEITPLDWIGVDGNVKNTYADLSHSDQQCISISANCEYPELAASWADFWFSDYGRQIWNWGLEGDAYELVDGEVSILDSLYENEWDISASSAMQAYSLASYSIPSVQDADRFSLFYSDAQAEAYDIWNSSSDASNFMIYTDVSPEYSEEYASIISDIVTYAETMVLSFITGTADIDTEWDTYIETLKSMDIDRAIEIMQLSYDDYLAK